MGKKNSVRYDDEFQINAVNLTIRKPVRQVALDLGVSEYSLHRWRKKHLEDGPLHEDTKAEIARLRSEVAELKQERDILKKSVAIFLKPQK